MRMGKEQLLDKLQLIDEQIGMFTRPRTLYQQDMLNHYRTLRRHYLRQLQNAEHIDRAGSH